MTRAIFHFGLPKTGSSALQSFLDTAIHSLLDNGYFYAGTDFPSSTIHSGNGGPLFIHASNNDSRSLSQAIASLAGPPSTHSIISCELFCHLSNAALADLVDALNACFEEITYVGYVRNLASYCYSEYSQSLKRHDETRGFKDFVGGTHFPTYSFIKKLKPLIRESDSIILRSYPDSDNFCIITDFLRLLDLSCLSPQFRLSLNRSLTPFEAQVFRFLNHLRTFSGSGKVSCASFSNHYMRLYRNAAGNAPLITPDVLDILFERYSDDIEYINTLLPERSRLLTLAEEKERLVSRDCCSMLELDGLYLKESEFRDVRILMNIYGIYTDLMQDAK